MRWVFSLLALLPFFPALSVSEGADIAALRLLIPIAALGWFFTGLQRRRVALPLTPPVLCVTAFIAFAALSFLWAEAPAFAFRKAAFFLSLLPVVLLVPLLASRAALRALVLGSLASSSIGLAAFFLQFPFGGDSVMAAIQSAAPILWGGASARAAFQFPSWFVDLGGATVLRAFIPFPDPHTAALFWGMGISGALALGGAWAVGAIVPLVAAIATFSRGGVAALAVVLVVFAAMRFLFGERLLRRQAGRRVLQDIGATLLLVTFFSVTFGGPLIGRLASTFDLSEGSNAARLTIWQSAVKEAAAHPLLGTGLGGFAAVADPSGGFRVPSNAHSTYLEIAAELGIVGLALFVSALGVAIAMAVRRARVSRAHAGIALALLFFAVHAVFETDLYSPPNFVALLVLLTLAGSNTRK
ncbi:MAG: O-antigen ligase family protein [Candidatus Terrybacteria bacterium]|nr:O-antigen ligase family protein [Candidatus Terrybacteria bacterium]